MNLAVSPSQTAAAHEAPARTPAIDYYQHSRLEIEPLLPATYTRVLEVGCGGGNTLRWLRDSQPGATTIAVELNAALTTVLHANADEVHIGDASRPPAGIAPVDLMLFLDVLEHFADPGAVLASYLPLLQPGGTVIVSVPNVAHYSVSLPLLFRRRFDYAEAGILDRTHLQFFTEASAIGLLNHAGLTVTGGVVNGPNRGRTRQFDRLTGGLFRHHLSKQYIMRAESGGQQQAVHWRA